MTEQEPQINDVKESLSSLFSSEFAAAGKKRLEEFVTVQTELWSKVQESNRNWFDRMQSESDLAAEFAGKLTAARSFPETATAYQQWATRRMELAAEDARRLFADSQKLMETGARLWSSGWLPNAHGIAS
jgi:hypothetical protein